MPEPLDPSTAIGPSELLFDGYLKYRSYKLTLGAETFEGGFVHGPGHFVAAVAAFAFDGAGKPHPIFKTGDTRLSRHERGEAYVLPGIVAGRLDKEGATAAKIVLDELAEEVGGQVLEGSFVPLGSAASPTMPFESSEADFYHSAAVRITGKPSGDGGAMEVVDLIGPLILSPDQAQELMNSGLLSEGGRALTMFCRAYDALGYLPQLDLYVHDHAELLARFDSLGLGLPRDPREQSVCGEFPLPQATKESLESRINHVVCDSRRVQELSEFQRLVAAVTRHAVKTDDQVIGLPDSFPNEYLQLDYDRAKLGRYFVHPESGPMLEMTQQRRPILALAEPPLSASRRDVHDLALQRGINPLQQLSEWTGELTMLGQPTSASSGQSDLYYAFVACRIDPPADRSTFVTLSEAIVLCRTGHGDAHTEAFCQRLAQHLGWIPNLGLSVKEALRLRESLS